MTESYVYLDGESSIHPGQPSPSGQLPPQQHGTVNDRLVALQRLFELASQETEEDHPLCADCAGKLREEVDAQLSEAEKECRAYEEALRRLDRDDCVDPLTEEEFAAEMEALYLEEREEHEKIRALTEQLKAVEDENQDLEVSLKDLRSMEGLYWNDFNDHASQLQSFREETEGLYNKIHVASSQLEFLKKTNVYNDVFHIWYDGPFGTISNFRMGRTANVHVEWEEINAAWGQAVLLLHAMARVEGFQFSEYKLLPMGSFPRIVDKHNIYELYGPVTQIVRANYDKGMICFLSCMNEFAEFAQRKDAETGRGKKFELPYKIENDKIADHTIRLRFNQDDRWTKALKFMLTDLKVLLAWFTMVSAGKTTMAADGAA